MRLKTTVVAGLALAGLVSGVQAAGGVQEGALAVRVPTGTSVKSIEVYLDVEGSAAREEQVAADSDSLLTVGRVRETMVDPTTGKVERRKSLLDQPVVFYLYSPTSKVGEFEINVQAARTAAGFVTEGSTPADFSIEALELRTVGDVRGRVLKTFDGVSFKIGETNRFPLEAELKSGKVLGVKISVSKPGAEEVAIQLKASKKGRYPAHVIRRGSEGAEEAGMGFYNPDVAFTYKGAPTGGKFVTGNPLERVAEQINNYVKGQLKAGKSGDVSVPLRVRVQTGETSDEK